MSEALIEVKKVQKYFPPKKRGGKEVKALDGVSFEIMTGEILGVVGESGCGKSTLGRCIMKLVDITQGEILYRGQDISRLNAADMKKLRQHMQMVFQNPLSSFNPKHTIGHSLREAAKNFGMSNQAIEDSLGQLMETISLDPAMLSRRPGELSGGQLQRLAIARALITKPDFIMADEPVSALDVSVQAQILNLLLDLRKEYDLTILFISHELTVVEHVCDRVVVMYLGKVMEMGTTESLFGNTLHPYSKALIASKPKEHPAAQRKQVLLEGDVPNAMEIPEGCRFHTRCPYAMKGKCNCEEPRLTEVEPGHWVACHLVTWRGAEQYAKK